MRVLVLGSGAREHAVTWMFSKSKRISGLFIAPGNAGTDELGTNLPDIDPEDGKQIIECCKENQIQFVFVGPEGPLAAGVVDQLNAEGINTFGPGKESAKLESSKVFSKEFMVRNNIPTAKSKEFKPGDEAALEAYVNDSEFRLVIKKSGLAAGKGVLESEDKNELIEFGKNILKDDSLIAEEFLSGYEVSIFVISDGKNFKVCPPCADYKKAEEGDQGLNTGGMGAICPVPFVTAEIMETILKETVEPTIKGLTKEGLNYKGLIYIGIMMTKDGPKVLEYNTRFGDPETQVLLPLIESDFGNLMDAITQQKLDTFTLRISRATALGVVIASEGYPGPYEKEKTIGPIPALPEDDAVIFHASTTFNEEGKIVTGGGRCFTAVGIAKDIISARVRAYEAAGYISFDGAWYRSDIGKKFFLE